MFGAKLAPPLAAAEARGDSSPLQRWEDEGGHRSADDEPDYETGRAKRAPAGLGWSEFLGRFFPDRRRHDLQALGAYAAYRSKGAEFSRKGVKS